MCVCVVEQIEDNDRQLAPLTGCITTQPRNKKYCARLSVNNAIVFCGGDVLHSSRVGQHTYTAELHYNATHGEAAVCSEEGSASHRQHMFLYSIRKLAMD